MLVFRAQGPGDILIFLPGQGEIERCVELLMEEARKFERSQDLKLVPQPLFSALPMPAQVTQPTDIPETSPET
jgi:HrpA-like RNA helicase